MGRHDPWESARLRLAIIKENFAYRYFFNLFIDTPYELAPELRRPQEDFAAHKERLGFCRVFPWPPFVGS
jgi:hypothetical protein